MLGSFEAQQFYDYNNSKEFSIGRCRSSQKHCKKGEKLQKSYKISSQQNVRNHSYPKKVVDYKNA